jgi:hypothetical protein
MGLFSSLCLRCGNPLLGPQAITHDCNEWMGQGVSISSDHHLHSGTYDGYGRLGATGDDVISDGQSVWHLACWELEGRPARYCGPCERAPDQGHFFNPGAYDLPDPRPPRIDRRSPPDELGEQVPARAWPAPAASASPDQGNAPSAASAHAAQPSDQPSEDAAATAPAGVLKVSGVRITVVVRHRDDGIHADIATTSDPDVPLYVRVNGTNETTIGPAVLDHNADLQGSLSDGFDHTDVEWVLAWLHRETGVLVVAVWDSLHPDGFEGGPRYYVLTGLHLYEASDQFQRWLTDDPDDPGRCRWPGRPATWAGRSAELGLRDLTAEGKHNYAVHDQRDPTSGEPEAYCWICGEDGHRPAHSCMVAAGMID